MRGRVRWAVPWLLAAAAGQVVAFEVVRRVFVGTSRGQRLDTAALSGNTIGRRHIDELVEMVLGLVTVASLVTATVVIGFIALIRGRVTLAVSAVALIAGANLTTQLLKWGIDRPDFGIDPARMTAGNSLPSGHTTVAASVVAALILVLPARLRPVAAVAGAGYAALAGVATLAAGWHRPSDAVAALLVVGCWTAVVCLALVVRPDRAPAEPATGGPGHRVAAGGLGLLGAVLLAAALVAMLLTDRALPTGAPLPRRELFVAYAGGAAGIAALACLVMALAMASVPLVTARPAVPERTS